MKILAVIKDEIIHGIFQKKYANIFLESKIDLILANSIHDYPQNIDNKDFNVIICDLDDKTDDSVEFYQTHKDKAKYLFITDMDFFTHLELLQENKISNIFPKGLLIEDYLTSAKLISNLCKGNVIGIHNYTNFPIFMETIPVHYTAHIRKLFFKIDFLFPSFSKDKTIMLKLAFSEILSNTFFHSHNMQKGQSIYLEEPIIVSFAEDREKILFSVMDKKGTLDRDSVFSWLLKRYQKADSLPMDHGRGLFLIKNIVDNLIINIKKDELTEFIAIFYKQNYMGEKSLIIQQL